MKITDEIFQVGGGSLSSPEDAAVYLIVYGDEAALVDAGCGEGTDRVLANVKKAGVDASAIRYLLLTHCHYDHTGGAAELKSRIGGMRVVAHQLDARYLESGDNRVTAAVWYGAAIKPFTVEKKLTESREEILLGGRKIEAVHLPGHSPGSVVYVTESGGKKVVFAQDVHGPLDAGFLSDRQDYLASLKRLLQIEADVLCEGHYGIYRGKNEVTAFIRQFMRT